MKRFLLYLLALTPLCSFAQITTGYYRVMNYYTERYMSIVDTNADIKVDMSSANKVDADLQAIHMLTGFEDSVAYNPATICFIEHINGTQYNLSGQGLDLYNTTGRLLDAAQTAAGYYRIYAEVSGITKYLIDNSYHGTIYFPSIGNANTTAPNRNWHILSVDQSADSYFGVKPDLQASADGSYWATQYAGFPFKPSAASTKVYTVCDVDNARGYAVIEEITGDVPAETPVLFLCGAATPSGNKLTLLDPNTSASSGTNYLQGNYYCNDVVANADAKRNHRNVRAYDPSKMRVLGVDSDGKPAFVKGNETNLVKSKVDGKLYIPANKAYLAVGASAPDTLEIITKEQYEAGIKAEGKTTFSDKVTEATDLSDTSIDDTYYTLSAANGDGYSAEEQSIVLNSTTTEEQMNIVENAEIGEAAVKDNFKGIIFEVPAGSGFVTVEVKTKGTHCLNVQVGKNEPKKLTKTERGIVQVEFNVTKPTYVYLYASAGSANSAPRRAAAENSVLLYGYEIKFASTTGIETINANVTPEINKTVYYDLSGRKLPGKPSAKGIYIVNGKKIVIK